MGDGVVHDGETNCIVTDVLPYSLVAGGLVTVQSLGSCYVMSSHGRNVYVRELKGVEFADSHYVRFTDVEPDGNVDAIDNVECRGYVMLAIRFRHRLTRSLGQNA